MAYLSKISITDDFMFATVLKNNKEACKRLLEGILGFGISELEYVNDQETINSYKNSHGIRLDVIAKDTGAIYDIEMQKINTGDIIKRSRYYQSQLDTAELLHSMDYEKLKNTYIIFICNFDPFDLDQYLYSFEYYDKKLDLSYGDGAKKILVNTKGHKGEISEDLKAFIDYINSPEYVQKEFVNDLIKQLDEAVWEYSKDEEWRVVHMKYEADAADLLRRGRTEGIEIGMTKGLSAIKDILELARQGKSVEYIATAINMPKEYVEQALELELIK